MSAEAKNREYHWREQFTRTRPSTSWMIHSQLSTHMSENTSLRKSLVLKDCWNTRWGRRYLLCANTRPETMGLLRHLPICLWWNFPFPVVPQFLCWAFSRTQKDMSGAKGNIFPNSFLAAFDECDKGQSLCTKLVVVLWKIPDTLAGHTQCHISAQSGLHNRPQRRKNIRNGPLSALAWAEWRFRWISEDLFDSKWPRLRRRHVLSPSCEAFRFSLAANSLICCSYTHCTL